jgi:SEC-C motif-containing protein
MDGPCPCGSSLAFASCCGPWLGGGDPPTAVALARARYTAYALEHIDFLLRTFIPDRQFLFDRETTVAWARRSHWLGLEIRRLAGGTADDETGTVEFVAWYRRAERRFRHHEIAEFRKDGGCWFYVDGTYPSASALLGAESRRLRR